MPSDCYASDPPTLDAVQQSTPSADAVDDTRWIVAATHPQAELWARNNLTRCGYVTFLPTCIITRRDRATPTLQRHVSAPLFPGYIFVMLHPHDPWTPIRYAPGVRDVLMSGQKPGYAPTAIVEALQAGEQLRRCPVPAGNAWRAGDPCRLATGPLQGQEAVVLRRISSRLVYIGLVFFGDVREMVANINNLERRD